jgi:predicted Fe-Mo cluster-binding NifX family protein
MKIAVPVTRENIIDSHFGHCEAYNVYTVSDNNEITNIKTIASPQGCGCKSDIATVFAADGVTIMLAGGIGDGAINVLGRNGIEVIRGCSGDATEVVKQFLSGTVEDSGSSCQQHHDHNLGRSHQCSHN